MTAINQNKVVSLNYILKDKDGNIIDASQENKPLIYIHGHNNLVDGLESKLENAKVGDKLNIEVSPKDGYGEYDKTLVREVSKELLFDPNETVEEGMLFTAETENGVVPFYIKKIVGEIVTIDGNHQLAGKTIFFDVEVISIREATDNEIEKGFPQIN